MEWLRPQVAVEPVPLQQPFSRPSSAYSRPSSAFGRPAQLPAFASMALQQGHGPLAGYGPLPASPLLPTRPPSRSSFGSTARPTSAASSGPHRPGSPRHPDVFKLFADQSVRHRAQLRDYPISGCPRPVQQKSSKFAGIA